MTWREYVRRVQNMILESRTLRDIRDLLGDPPPLPPKDERRGKPGRKPQITRGWVPLELFERWDSGDLSTAEVARQMGMKYEACRKRLLRERALKVIEALGGEVPFEDSPPPVRPLRERVIVEAQANVVVEVATVEPCAASLPTTKLLEPRWVVMGDAGQPTGWFPVLFLASVWQAAHGGQILPCRPWPGGGIEIEDDGDDEDQYCPVQHRPAVPKGCAGPNDGAGQGAVAGGG